jgi:hypothetical protein
MFGVRGPSPAHLIDVPEVSNEYWSFGNGDALRLSDTLMIENGSATSGFAL